MAVSAWKVLSCPMQPNDADADTVGDYLKQLLLALLQDGEDFSSKRPFGNSGWEYELYTALVREGLVNGVIDEDGYLHDVDALEADKLLRYAVMEMQ